MSISPEELNTYEVQEGDILINRVNSLSHLGKSTLVPKLSEPAVFESNMMRLRLDEGAIVPQFVIYQLVWPVTREYFRSRAKLAVAQTSINQGDIRSLPIYLPPLAEQHAIASTLRAAQAAVQARRRLAELERERKAALMQALFTRGTRGEATKTTEIGEVPESWEVMRLGDTVLGTQYGLSIRGETSGSYPLLRMNNLSDGQVVPDNLQFIELAPPTFEQYRLVKGDLLFNRTNSVEHVGRTGIFDIDGNYVFASYLVRIKPDYQKAEPAFLNYYLNWPPTQSRLKGMASRGVSQSNINASKLATLITPVPSLPEQREIAEALRACDAVIAGLEREAALHEELFRALLEELMTGRVRVSQ